MKGIQVEETPGGGTAQCVAAGPARVLLGQDLLRGPERKLVRGDAQRRQPLLTGVQQRVVFLQIKPTSLSGRFGANRDIDKRSNRAVSLT